MSYLETLGVTEQEFDEIMDAMFIAEANEFFDDLVANTRDPEPEDFNR